MNHEQEKLGIMGRELENIDLTVSQRKQITALLKLYLPNTEVWAYGSRVKFTARPSSDLDMVAFASKEQRLAVANLKEAFEESSLPFRVDLFVWDEVPEQFHKNIEDERVVLQEKKKQSDLPEGWEERVLGDIAEIEMGQSPAGNTCNKDGNGTPLLNGPTEFGSNHPIPTQFTIDPRKFAVMRDLLFCVRGSTGRMNWADQKYAIGRGLAAIRHKGGSDYQPFIKGIIDYHLPVLHASATGSTFPNISRNQLIELPITAPPLPEQKAIAHILGSLDDKIELNRRMNETLEAMAQALFKSWFVDFDPVIDNALIAGLPLPEELWQKGEIRRGTLEGKYGSLDAASKSSHFKLYHSHFPSEFIWTDEMGWIPKGWRVRTVDSVIEINPTVKLQKNTVAPFVDMKTLPTTGYSVGEIIKKTYSGGAKFQNGDILLARITPCLENGKTAIADFLDDDQAGFGSTEFIILRGQGAIGTPFVACLSRNGKFRDHCIQSMVGSSGRQRVQNSCFANFHLSLPENNHLLDHFHLLTEGSFNKISKHSDQSQVSTNLRDTLLPKLLSGEIRLPAAFVAELATKAEMPEDDISAWGQAQVGKLVEDLNNNGGNNGKS